MKRFALLLVAIMAFSILSGCDDSSGSNKITAENFEGGYYHTTYSDGYRLDFKDGKCAIYYSPDLTTERCIGESPFSEYSIEGQSYFIVINDGNNLKNNKDWMYTKFPSADFNWLNP